MTAAGRIGRGDRGSRGAAVRGRRPGARGRAGREGSVAWPFADWWSQLTADPTWATAVAAAAAAVATVALIVLAVRQLRPWRPGGGQVEFGDEANRARLDVAATERALRRRLEKDLPGVKTRELRLTQARRRLVGARRGRAPRARRARPAGACRRASGGRSGAPGRPAPGRARRGRHAPHVSGRGAGCARKKKTWDEPGLRERPPRGCWGLCFSCGRAYTLACTPNARGCNRCHRVR